jgi:hypothetical protein
MSIPFVPHAFKAGDNLDLEKLNDNLEAIGRDNARSFEARYTYSEIRLDLTALTTASAASIRKLAIRRPASSAAVEVYAVELQLYGNAAGAGTVTCSDVTWPVLPFTTTATATDEITASSNIPVSVPSSAADVTFTVAFPAGYTVTAGYLVVHLRCDRGNQGDNLSPVLPSLLSSATANPADALDVELDTLGVSVGQDTAASSDLRCECYATRSLAGTPVVFRVPSGARRLKAVGAYCFAAAGIDLSVDVAGSGLTAVNVPVVSDGATLVYAVANAGAVATTVDDPMDSTDDTTITLSRVGVGTIAVAYALLWWS